MPFDVRRIANATLEIADAYGHQLTNMAVNKIIYFGHGWHLAEHDEALVDTPFEAWQHGPVHPVLYRQFKPFGANAIIGRATRVDLATGEQVPIESKLPGKTAEHLDRIVRFYGGVDAARLSQISHETGAPWDRIWNRSGSTPGMSIPDSLTLAYYRSKLQRTN